MEKNKNIENEINEKKNLIENIGKEENIKKEEIEFLKYDKLLEIKKLENNIKENQFIVDLLNYHYNKIIYSSKANFIIDVCFGLRNFLYYLYDFDLDKSIPLVYISKNLPLFKCQKDKLLSLFEENIELNLSHLFPLYEYFESLIFTEFIYHINKGYFEPISLYLSKKILYIFEKDEMKKNIIFTKLEFIEAIRKCLCRYIASSTIDDNFITENLDSDLFELLLKEDLWGSNIKMQKLKESFNYIKKNIKFKLQTKYIFNLFEILIDIPNKNYFSFDNFKEEEEGKEKEKEKDILEILEIKKEEEKENDKKKEEVIHFPKINIEKKEIDETKDLFFLDDKQYNMILDRKKYFYQQMQNSKLISKYLENINAKDKSQDKANLYLPNHKEIITEIIKYGSIFYGENLVSKFYEFIKEPNINIKLSSLGKKTDILHLGNDIKQISLFNKNKIIIIYDNGKFEIYSFDKKIFRENPSFVKLTIENLPNINNIDKINCMKELIDESLLFGTKNGHILKMNLTERKKNNNSNYILQLVNDIKLENKESIDDLIEINTNIFISKHRENYKILDKGEIKKELKGRYIFKNNYYLIIFDDSSTIFYDIKNNFEEISKIETKFLNPSILNEKIIVCEDNDKYNIHLLNILEKKNVKEKAYNPHKSFILTKLYKSWYFILSKNDKDKLIKINLIDENGNYDLISDNEEFIILESSKFLTNLYDEFFIICKNGNITCYGYFL